MPYEIACHSKVQNSTTQCVATPATIVTCMSHACSGSHVGTVAGRRDFYVGLVKECKNSQLHASGARVQSLRATPQMRRSRAFGSRVQWSPNPACLRPERPSLGSFPSDPRFLGRPMRSPQIRLPGHARLEDRRGRCRGRTCGTCPKRAASCRTCSCCRREMFGAPSRPRRGNPPRRPRRTAERARALHFPWGIW